MPVLWEGRGWGRRCGEEIREGKGLKRKRRVGSEGRRERWKERGKERGREGVME